MRFVADVPTRLIERLRAGDLDAALVSSIEAFRGAGYRVAPGLAIACRGPVRSVRAFRRRDVPIRSVGLDSGSETSVALLKVLLRERLGATAPTFERIEPTRTPDRLPHDLVLLIGDCGLHADAGEREALDLGALWHEWTGLPFVFALWLLAPGADAARVVPRLRAARARAIADRIEDGTGGAIHYTFGDDERRGLLRFRDEAVRLGLAPGDVAPTFLDFHQETVPTKGSDLHHD